MGRLPLRPLAGIFPWAAWFVAAAPLSAEVGNVVVLPWPDGRTATLSLTHDDNDLDHINLAAPALEARGLRGTFNVYPGNWDEKLRKGYAALARRGHELGSHTMNHQWCQINPSKEVPGRIAFHSLDELNQDCLKVKALLDPLQFKHRTISFTFPYGNPSPEASEAIKKYFLSARTTTTPLTNSAYPGWKRYELAECPVGGGNNNQWRDDDYTYAQLSLFMQIALDSGGWVLENYHAFRPNGYAGNFNHEAYYRHLDDLAAAVAAGKLWVAPQGDVAQYIVSRDRTRIDVTQNDRQAIRFIANDGYRDNPYDRPLTFRIQVPPTWLPGACVYHQGILINNQIAIKANQAYIFCNTFADGGETVIVPGEIKESRPREIAAKP